ncbi:MAG: D-cysteine desulfhydrase family protein [Pseudomonas sp.]
MSKAPALASYLTTASQRIRSMARVAVAQLPTPLEEVPRLSRQLGGPRLFFKRDDLTGAGLGGNKVRKLEYVIGKAMVEGADTLVLSGGFQSNLARIAAALGARLGLEVELVLGGLPDEPRPTVGNLLLDQLFGARITLVDTVPRWEFGDAVEQVAAAARRRGRKPFVVPLGGSGPEGMASYVAATTELLEQCDTLGLCPDYLAVAIGSGGTFGGLMLGALNLHAPYQVLGISVSRTREYLREKIPADTAAAATVLQLAARPSANDLLLYDEYIGEGYGRPTAAGNAAIALVARSEGIVLDPVYSGKCMAGLIDLIGRREIAADATVVFLHTGGSPALFAYRPEQLGLGLGVQEPSG